MSDLGELDQRRTELYARLAAVGDFRAGSINETWRRGGKPNCACAQPGHHGHGPGICGPGRWAAGPAGISWDPETRPPARSSRLAACSSPADKKRIVSLSFSDKELAFAPARGSGR
jgi:hypothetical protein